ncbi:MULTISPECIES: glycogen debranching N-terminal domain-containing protein [unclassified Beijerinckia]|uniref:amylo-alpha-1,6-glucosidase n=1 Tax=unclassified Beijerinckia TaxID=2638183 RepID=UPI000899DF9C|nr:MULTISPECIES: glycogen debranching N-terminal domain-containing protein [unclassified Beijerinckia]MDH7798912.1 glycogen debranching enzyme [Beijerinckia sp. GAS462]SED87199.1 Glycogen debranching enzyme (alpha-1,6-glucosidase) [Beijerinckia sp. 28-YEA-48]
MAFRVQVGPDQIAIHQGHTVLVTEPDGQINWPSKRGLYFRDTRVISAWAIYANGEPWDLLNGGAVAPHAARIFLTNGAFVTEGGPIAARTLGLVIGRHIDGGLHEDLDITNNSQQPVRFNLEIAIRADFADIFEVKGEDIVRRGRITTAWSAKREILRITYRNKDFCREVIIRTSEGVGKPTVNANGRLSFDIALKPGQAWHRCLIYGLVDGSKLIRGPKECHHGPSDHADKMDEWQRTVLKITSSNEEFYRCYSQGIQDMAALRLPLQGTDHMVFVPAAGLPWFLALFGRDTLIVSLQTMIVYPEFAAGALEVLGRYQATQRDDYRDAEPGKILHELRYGELAHFKLIPHTPYYGTADATPLYLVALHAAWRATGDAALIKRQLPNAEACLTWIDKYGDRDGDGFQEYQTRSTAGYENMSWKDSGDAVMYADGSLVRGPKALCELQGYVYDAWLRMAEIYDELGNRRRANALRKKAAALFKKFNDDFWDEKTGFYAYALDGDKKKVLSVTSNVGHCLWSGIIAPERAAIVVKRLMQKDMWSGWGIRTLSANHPSFNPYNYQTGAVWPHDNSLIAFGMRRYGFAAEAAKVARDISGAARYFLLNQLPELYAGLQRDPTNFPVQYLGANVPQAWAAGSPFMLLQAMLGLEQDAPRGKLYVDPALPDWLLDITLTDLRLGKKSFDIRFWRDGKDTLFKVLKGNREVVERRAVCAHQNATSISTQSSRKDVQT